MNRVNLKQVVTVGVRFIENQNPCRVTRVTDLDFDTLDEVTGQVSVRSLHEWEAPRFVNSISGVTGLLRVRENVDATGNPTGMKSGIKKQSFYSSEVPVD